MFRNLFEKRTNVERHIHYVVVLADNIRPVYQQIEGLCKAKVIDTQKDGTTLSISTLTGVREVEAAKLYLYCTDEEWTEVLETLEQYQDSKFYRTH